MFHRYFLKVVLGIPRNTHNYVIEMGVNLLQLYDLKLHFDYVIGVFALRLQYTLACFVVDRMVGWFKDWLGLTEKYELSDNIGDCMRWKGQLEKLSEKKGNCQIKAPS